MKSIKTFALLAVLFISFAEMVQAQKSTLITPNFAGPVRIGMTVKQVRKAVGRMTVSRTIISDGVPALMVKSGGKKVMIVTANNITADASVDVWKINENAKIDYIQVYDKSFRTAAGVNPGMLISEVEKKYGRVKQISISEIEQQEYVEFAKAPKAFTFRAYLKGTYAGTYLKAQTKTAKYKRRASVLHIDLAK